MAWLNGANRYGGRIIPNVISGRNTASCIDAIAREKSTGVSVSVTGDFFGDVGVLVTPAKLAKDFAKSTAPRRRSKPRQTLTTELLQACYLLVIG